MESDEIGAEIEQIAEDSGLDTEMILLLQSNEVLRENWEAATQALISLRVEDEGWLPINQMRQHDGFAIHHLKQIYEKSKLQTKTNPLLKRGLSLRTSYVWGRGIRFDGDLKPRHLTLIEKNESALFSQSAFAALERSLYTSGNLFMAVRTDGRVFQIPFDEVTNFASDPDLNSELRYIQRTWYPVDIATGAPAAVPTIEWYPLWETRRDASNKAPVAPSIANQRVRSDIVVVDVRVNRDSDEIWGVPDVLPAMPYAWAHAEYLKDGSKLLKALSTIAWKVVSKSKPNATSAGAKVAEIRRAGGVANMTNDTDLVSMPKAGQVDLGDGDRIASYVAAALGVSLTALLSTAGASGGSFGAEATLDTPQENEALARQAVWKDQFFDRVLEALGFPDDIEVCFRSITADPAYRSAQTLTLAFKSGAIHQSEYRKQMLELGDIEPIEPIETLPKPNGFTGAQQTNQDQIAEDTLQLQKDQLDLEKKQAADQAAVAKQNAANQIEIQKHQINTNAKLVKDGVDPSPGQGQTGAVGKMNQGDHTNRDAARTPGTSSVKKA